MKIERTDHYATVGDLLQFIKDRNLPLDGKILIQRVEDCYFEGCDISGFTGTLPDGTIGKFPQGSKATPWKTIDKDTNNDKSQYIPVWSPVFYTDDTDNLYLDAHY